MAVDEVPDFAGKVWYLVNAPFAVVDFSDKLFDADINSVSSGVVQRIAVVPLVRLQDAACCIVCYGVACVSVVDVLHNGVSATIHRKSWCKV